MLWFAKMRGRRNARNLYHVRYLAQAGDLAAKNLPEEVKALKERYGFKTLKKLLAGSEMFDIFDEPLSSGRFRTLYRKKEMH